MVRAVTTPKKRPARPRARKPRARPAPAPAPAESESATPLDTFLEPPAPPVSVATTTPELSFAARVPPPEPARPRPTVRRAIFFDVENSSRSDHVGRVLAHLAIDRAGRATELVAVGNWRVINHETARMLAERGAQLVHSAPSVGVRDWSDLRIAVAAGVWLAAARAGDAIEIVTDDQAFDAVGDVASSLGVEFRRLSYRGLSGATAEELPEEPPATDPSARRRRRSGRGGRGRRREREAPRHVASPPPENGAHPEGEAHTAPHDELLAVARELIVRAPEGTVTIDALSNALKARGFRRTPGSPRLITRLRRIKELDVGRNGAIRLVNGGVAEPLAIGAPAEGPASDDVDVAAAGEPAGGAEPPPEGEPGAAPAAPRRRRRRGGRRRRGRGSGHAAPASA
jgi:hypothetical protein